MKVYVEKEFLQQYRIKATFFTVGKDGYDDVYRRIVGDGHTLGMHSYSHDYSKVYSSVEAFGKDFIIEGGNCEDF